jgi:hypothetical protein
MGRAAKFCRPGERRTVHAVIYRAKGIRRLRKHRAI